MKKCKNKKCQRILPEGYERNYCENCRNERIKRIKTTGKSLLGVVAFVGTTALAIVSKGKINCFCPG